MLQVASGLLRGVKLRSPTGPQTRPSSERLRQAIFNVLRHYRFPDCDNIIDGAVVVDLFSGTGAWAIEALSNGASEAWFVESHPLALKTLQENLNIAARCFAAQRLAVPRLELVRRDVGVAYAKLPTARLVFCDPPYDSDWLPKIAALEAEHDRLVKGGLFIFEARGTEKISSETKGLRLFDSKNYGDSSVHFFVKD